MNNNRLSTTPEREVPLVSRELILLKVNKLLNQPSNFELKEDGEIFIKSLGRNYQKNLPNVIQMFEENKDNCLESWDSMKACALGLGMSMGGIQYRLKARKCFEHKGKSVYLKKSPL